MLLLSKIRSIWPSIFGNNRNLKTMNSIIDKKESIVWMDMEMTGLQLRKDKILEIGCLITDVNLNVIAEIPEIVIHQSDFVLSSMNDWCMEQHEKTGLIQASRESKTSIEVAENILLDFLQNHIPKGVCPLAGNTIYMDRMFLREYLPRVDEYLHYHIIDVSSIKELCQRWNPTVFSKLRKEKVHRSLADIRASIDELKYYKTNLFLH